jgi:hypothetical protein
MINFTIANLPSWEGNELVDRWVIHDTEGPFISKPGVRSHFNTKGAAEKEMMARIERRKQVIARKESYCYDESGIPIDNIHAD